MQEGSSALDYAHRYRCRHWSGSQAVIGLFEALDLQQQAKAELDGFKAASAGLQGKG